MNRKSKNTVKKTWDFVGIFTCECKFVCVSVCVCVCVCVRMYLCLCGLELCIIVYVWAYSACVCEGTYILPDIISCPCVLCCYIIVEKDSSISLVIITYYIYRNRKRSSVQVPEFDKHLKKAKGESEITVKTIVRKP